MRVSIKVFILSSLAALILGAFVTAAGFWWWLNGFKNQPSSLLSQMTNGNAVILNQFNAIGNLEGFVVQNNRNSNQSIVYVDNQGRYLILGTVLSADGHNLSEQNYQQYIAPKASNVAFSYIGNTSWIQQGSNSAPHQLYVVFDPNCTFCHRVYVALQPFIAKGDLAVRWIPVAFLKPSSMGKVYAILSSSNPLQMMAQNEANFNEGTEDGGIPPLTNPSARVRQQLQNNMAFLTEAQINATPALLYKTRQGVAKLDIGVSNPGKLEDLVNTMGQCF